MTDELEEAAGVFRGIINAAVVSLLGVLIAVALAGGFDESDDIAGTTAHASERADH